MKAVKSSTGNQYNLTQSDSANKMIAEWEQAVADIHWLKPSKEREKNNTASTSSQLYDKGLGGAKNRVKRAIEVLTAQKLIDKESVVLDLGCGTGAFALPFSKIVKRVDAVDISLQRINYLHEKVEKEKAQNIRIIRKDCIDFMQNNDSGKYDLVISSYNPDMYSGQALLGMTRLSKRVCLFSCPYKNTESQIKDELDALIFGEDSKSDIDGRAIIYPFNILFFLGYKPQLDYVEDSWGFKESPDEAIERLTKRYISFMKVTEEIRNVIKIFVYTRQKDGFFEQNTVCHVGLMIWKVDKKSQY